MLDRLYPLIPAKLPDGRTVWEERGKARDVRDAVAGYDPRMSLVRNFEADQWEVWRANEDGSQARIGTYPGERLPEPRQVLDDLYGHDCWKGYDPLDAYLMREAAHEKGIDDALDDIALASADQMHYELVDEFSSHMPAARPMSFAATGDRRRRRAERDA